MDGQVRAAARTRPGALQRQPRWREFAVMALVGCVVVGCGSGDKTEDAHDTTADATTTSVAEPDPPDAPQPVVVCDLMAGTPLAEHLVEAGIVNAPVEPNASSLLSTEEVTEAGEDRSRCEYQSSDPGVYLQVRISGPLSGADGVAQVTALAGENDDNVTELPGGEAAVLYGEAEGAGATEAGVVAASANGMYVIDLEGRGTGPAGFVATNTAAALETAGTIFERLTAAGH